MQNNKLKSKIIKISKFFRFYLLDLRLSQKAKGFTLLMSMLVISIILSIGLGVSDVIIRETKISGLGRESQIAFSAADAGVECAFFWEIKHPGMAQSAFNTANTIGCAGNSVSNNFSGGISSFSVNLGNSSCVSVKVDKTPPSQTIIESRGYNTDCGSISPFKVERAIRLTLNKVVPQYKWVNIGTDIYYGGRVRGSCSSEKKETINYLCSASNVGDKKYDGNGILLGEGVPDTFPMYEILGHENVIREYDCHEGTNSSPNEVSVWECQAQ